MQTTDYFNYIGRITAESSTRPNMKMNYLLDYSFETLTLAKQKEVEKAIIPVFSLTQNIQKEIKKLEETRDCILPRLLNGEVIVK